MNAKVKWLRPLTEADHRFFGVISSARAQSLWGVEINGILQEEKFTNKKAAQNWMRFQLTKKAVSL